MSHLPTCETSASATSSLESAGGHLPSLLPGFALPAKSGPPAAHASHSATPARAKAPTTTGTFGQSFPDLWQPAGLQSRLANKLHQRLGGTGSLEYALTWKEWAMKSGGPICALRASGHPTSASESSGWPTPTATDAIKGGEVSPRPGMMGLSETVGLAGWPTPQACDGPNNGTNRGKNHGGERPRTTPQNVPDLVGWITPSAGDGVRGGVKTAGMTGNSLTQQTATVAGWQSPQARDYKSGKTGGEPLTHNCRPLSEQALGAMPNCSDAPTGKRGVLNPEFSRWLMGYPAGWGFCGDMAMRLCRRLQRSSLKKRLQPSTSELPTNHDNDT